MTVQKTLHAVSIALLAPAALLACSSPAKADESLTVDEIIKQSSMATPQIMSARHLWAELNIASDWDAIARGAQAGIGYRFRYFGVDSRFSLGRTNYGAISVNPGPNQTPNTEPSYFDLNSELNRPRHATDSWSYRLVEPGLSVSGKIFPVWLPLLTQQARVGLAYGAYNDNQNNIPFHSIVFTTEAMLLCQLGADSPWSVSGALSYNAGILVADTPNDAGMQSRRLPVSWVGTSIGLQFAF
jgi:hypothetical protein